ncbi:MAG: peptidylprolyl isomerase [Deltaproteobacteria bacterium]|nr:peptidylprolyl isomerase [Deltaproteobacteria bacterium]
MSRWTVLLAVAVVLAGCARDQAEHKETSSSSASAPAGGGLVIATYSHKRFTTADFAREVERLPPRSRSQLTTPDRKRQFIDNYVMNDLLADEGAAHGYDKDPEVMRQVEELRRRLVTQRVMKDFQEPPELTEAEVKAYYDQNRRLFSGAQIRASHILVKDEALAKRLREELRREPSKFDEFAKANSTDTATAARGGDLGFFAQGRMVAPFEQAAFALDKPGDMSEVVKTPFGYHIIKLTERKEGGDRPFDEVKERIRVNLINQRRQAQVQQRLDDLRAKAKITIDDAVLAAAEIPGAAPTTAPSPAVHEREAPATESMP